MHLFPLGVLYVCVCSLHDSSKLQWPAHWSQLISHERTSALPLHSADNTGHVNVMSVLNIYELAPLLTKK